MVLRFTTFAMVLALSAPSLAQAAVLRQQSSRDWNARGLARVEVENPSGEVTVRPSRDGQVHLVALKTVRNGSARAAERLARDTRVVADLVGGVLRIGVRYPSGREIHLTLWDLLKHVEWPELQVRLAIEMPPGLDIALTSASGDLQTEALAGRQEVLSSSGDIDIAGALGAVSIETRSGDVTVAEMARTTIGTSSGDVVAGSIRGPLGIETRSGDIRIDSATDSVKVISSSGDVTLRVGRGVDYRIDARASSGDVEINLPLDVRTSKDNHVIGRLGRATTAIVLRTSSGSINVAR